MKAPYCVPCMAQNAEDKMESKSRYGSCSREAYNLVKGMAINQKIICIHVN